MGYSIRDSETGLSVPVVLTSYYAQDDTAPSWVPEYWHCDPSAPSSRRYTVKHTCGEIIYPWYELIIVGYDDARTIASKVDYWQRVQAAQDALNVAQRAYNDLTR